MKQAKITYMYRHIRHWNMRSGTEKITSRELQTTASCATGSKRTCLSSILEKKYCEFSLFYRVRYQNCVIIINYMNLLYRKYALPHQKHVFCSYPSIRLTCNIVSVMNITTPRNSYQYNVVAVKLPGSIVAMDTICSVDFLIVVLYCMYFFPSACARTNAISLAHAKKKRKTNSVSNIRMCARDSGNVNVHFICLPGNLYFPLSVS